MSNNSDIETYFFKLKDKLEEKQLKDFWIFPDRSDFKPIKNTTRKQIQSYLKEKVRYYAGKKIANVYTTFRPRINFNNITEDDFIYRLNIIIFEISEDGSIDTNIGDSWDLIIIYNKKELAENHFSLKELDIMIKMASERKIITDLGGITYNKWIHNYNNVLKKQRKNSKTNLKRESKRSSKGKLGRTKKGSKCGSKWSSKCKLGRNKKGSKCGSKCNINLIY
jgi:hypothetical protein